MNQLAVFLCIIGAINAKPLDLLETCIIRHEVTTCDGSLSGLFVCENWFRCDGVETRTTTTYCAMQVVPANSTCPPDQSSNSTGKHREIRSASSQNCSVHIFSQSCNWDGAKGKPVKCTITNQCDDKRTRETNYYCTVGGEKVTAETNCDDVNDGNKDNNGTVTDPTIHCPKGIDENGNCAPS